MRFGPVAVGEAAGAILAHQTIAGRTVLKKGRRLSDADIALLEEAGVEMVIAARLDPGDLDEDAAAERIAALFVRPGIVVERAHTGRVNLFAEQAGVFVAQREVVNAMNRVDPGVTFATLPSFSAVEAGRMIATVKIIPFAVSEAAVDGVSDAVRGVEVLSLHPFRPLRVALVQTLLPGQKPSIFDKTRRVLEARLAKAGATVASETRVAHRADDLAEALRRNSDGADLVIVFGASAISDLGDVIPAALQRAGGTVVHLGMPVDPGNLLLVGRLGDRPVLGAPGCARSPAENGFDWVLDRLLAGVEVTPDDITGMGVGGLLMEILSRPQPRVDAPAERRVAAVVLAAGRSSRTGERSKLLAEFSGEPLIRRAVRAAIDAGIAKPVVITGHRAERVSAALSGLDVRLVHNPDFADGLSTSLRAGFRAAAPDAGGVLVMLGDMPGVEAAHVRRMVDAFYAAPRGAIVVATAEGRRGNPVLLDTAYADAIDALSGDEGARPVLFEFPERVIEVEIGGAARLDVDTAEAVSAAGGILVE